jgi:hypothetical protein
MTDDNTPYRVYGRDPDKPFARFAMRHEAEDACLSWAKANPGSHGKLEGPDNDLPQRCDASGWLRERQSSGPQPPTGPSPYKGRERERSP